MKPAPIVLAALLCACAGARTLPSGVERRVVEAEGWAEQDGSGPSSARMRALADAQRRAVESAGGLELSARTKVTAGVAVEQSITAETGGSIERYEVLSESQDKGLFKVRLKVSIVMARRPGGPSRTTVTVRLSEDAGAGVRRALSEQGFVLLSDSSEADWIVDGQSKVVLLAQTLVPGLMPCRARVSLQAARRGTGVLLQAAREASAMDAVEPLAQAKALELAGLLAGETLGRQLKGDETASAPGAR